MNTTSQSPRPSRGATVLEAVSPYGTDPRRVTARRTQATQVLSPEK
jgi:hypothetical protein